MTPEEYERFKEAEKEHLRKLKKLKEAARLLERQKKIANAVTGMSTSMQEKFDEHREMVDRLGMEAAMTEARMEVAMDSTEERAQQINQASDDEETLRKERARELIRRMQQEAASSPDVGRMSGTVSSPDATRGSCAASSSDSASISPTPDSKEKSRAQTPASAPGPHGSVQGPSQKKGPELPEKTIGRMKP